MSFYAVRPEVLRLRPYVPGKPVAEVQREFGLVDVVKLASNENPLGPSPLALRAVQAAAAGAHIYPDPAAPALRQALAIEAGLPPEWIFVGNGSDEILRLMATSYLRAGDPVVLPDSSFPNYLAVSELMGAEVRVVPLAGEAMDLAEMARQSAGARLIFLCRPNNPTGAVFPEDAFRRFMGEVPPDTLVLIDQAYHEFDSSPFDSLGLLRTFPNLVLTRTFSKAYGLAGMRIGYGLARPEIWAPLLTVREPFSVNTLAQAAALAALQDDDHLAQTLRVVREGKAFLMGLCDELGLRYVESEANFLFIDLGRPAQPVFQALLRQGVVVRPCGGFGRPTCLRVTAGRPAELERLAVALRGALASPAD